MKYPWVAVALATVWFGSTYIIIKSPLVDPTMLLFVSILGTIVIAFIGFRPPKIK